MGRHTFAHGVRIPRAGLSLKLWDWWFDEMEGRGAQLRHLTSNGNLGGWRDAGTPRYCLAVFLTDADGCLQRSISICLDSPERVIRLSHDVAMALLHRTPRRGTGADQCWIDDDLPA